MQFAVYFTVAHGCLIFISFKFNYNIQSTANTAISPTLQEDLTIRNTMRCQSQIKSRVCPDRRWSRTLLTLVKTLPKIFSVICHFLSDTRGCCSWTFWWEFSSLCMFVHCIFLFPGTFLDFCVSYWKQWIHSQLIHSNYCGIWVKWVHSRYLSVM